MTWQEIEQVVVPLRVRLWVVARQGKKEHCFAEPVNDKVVSYDV
jgi:hypothetical protein